MLSDLILKSIESREGRSYLMVENLGEHYRGHLIKVNISNNVILIAYAHDMI